MKCASCQHDNPDRARFCLECGVAFTLQCLSCNSELPPNAKFCLECGTAQVRKDAGSITAPDAKLTARRAADYTPKHLAAKILQSRSALEGERKQVTVLFADVKGSMQLAGQIDAEAWHRVLDHFFQILADAVHRFEGTINQYTGDGIMALFGAPLAHENHAQRACFAALHMREQLQAYADRLRVELGISFGVRIGINSGEVVVGKIGDDLRMDYTAQGHSVGIAQRLEQLSESGRIYLSEHTERLVSGYFTLRDLGASMVAGITAPLRIYELESASKERTRLEVSRSRGLSRFVGRLDEIHTLASALQRAREGHGQVVGVVGDAGVGKSRLCFEFVEHCRRQRIPVFEANCLAHGRNIPLMPILELFRSYFGITEQDTSDQARQKIAGTLVLIDSSLQETLPVLFEFLGVPDPMRPPPTLDADARQRRLFALLRQINRIQAARGVASVVLIDDVHWIDSASDRFLAQMVDAAAEGSRNLLLLNFRPEYGAPWMRRAHYHQLPLTPLSVEAVAELLATLLGNDASLRDLAQRIARRASGNPFYTEEIVRQLVENECLLGAPGNYRLAQNIDDLPVPDNVRGILASRIDRLGDHAKATLQVAAVVGREFKQSLLADVLARLHPEVVARDALGGHLKELIEGEFIYEQAIYPEVELSFKHPLTREVALSTQLNERRRGIHANVAQVFEQSYAGRLDEYAAHIAHHHEEAGNALAAARWHRRAAEWAGHQDFNAALAHWQKVRVLASEISGDPEATVLLAHGSARALGLGWRLGAIATSWRDTFEQGQEAARKVGDYDSLALLSATYGIILGLTERNADGYRHYAEVAVQVASEAGTEAEIAILGHWCLAWANFWLGNTSKALHAAERVLDLTNEVPRMGGDVIGVSPRFTLLCARLNLRAMRGELTNAVEELALRRQEVLTQGFDEEALMFLWLESNLKCAMQDVRGIETFADTAQRLASGKGLGSELGARLVTSDVLALTQRWGALKEEAETALSLIRQKQIMWPYESYFLAHVARAELGFGDIPAARYTAEEGVQVIRETKVQSNPMSYALLARAQLALGEPADDICNTLDEYEALLTRTELYLFTCELHELRAQLAAREGRQVEQVAALSRAREGYTRFGMIAQAARVGALKTGS